jgi:DNA-binding phage protein
MIRKSLITFDAHSQIGGTNEVRIVGEDLLLEKEPIQVISSVFWKLPFRLRLGRRTEFKVGGITPSRIVVFNSIDIPETENQKRPPDPKIQSDPEMASTVLMTLDPTKIDEDTRLVISKALDHSDYSKVTPLHIHPEDLLCSLNSLTVSYLVILGDAVRWNRVRRILRKDVSGGHTYEIHMFKRKHEDSNLKQIEDSIADAKPTLHIPFLGGGAMHDISAEEIANLQNKIAHNTQYAFYSLAIQAQDYIQQTDYLNALLYSIIAFENAHAEFIEYIAETKANCSKARIWAQELLRQAGISAIVRLTPYLFMTPEGRPSDNTISSVVKAIKIRNELAHAKRDNNGNLKVDSHKSRDLLPLIEEVFNYINAIARQLPD